jgi:hypothetical protein
VGRISLVYIEIVTHETLRITAYPSIVGSAFSSPPCQFLQILNHNHRHIETNYLNNSRTPGFEISSTYDSTNHGGNSQCPRFHLRYYITLETDKNAQEFHCFRALPPELRIIVWKKALKDLEPRLVPIVLDARLHNVLTNAKPPALLSVSREARHEAIKEYEPSFTLSNSSTVIPFNFAIDVLYMPYAVDREIFYRDYFQQLSFISNGEKVLTIAVTSHELQMVIPPKVFPNLQGVAVAVFDGFFDIGSGDVHAQARLYSERE